MPLCCAIYEHAAACLGETPWRVSRAAELLFRAHAAAYRRYRHTPVVVGIDVYHVEAEADGAVVVDGGGMSVPALPRPPLVEVAQMLALPPRDPRAGRLPLVLEAGQRLRAAFPEADVRIPVTGPFTLAAMLAGLEPLLEALALEPDTVAAALSALAARQRGWVEAITAAGLGVIVFESAASPPMLSPAQARGITLPALAALLRDVRALSGAGGMLIQGGDIAPIAADFAGLPVAHLLCPAETDQAAFLAGMAARPAVTVRVNMAAGVIAAPSWPPIQRELDRLRALAARHPAATPGTGVVPYATPEENIRRACAYWHAS